MKKIGVVLLFMIILLGICSCSHIPNDDLSGFDGVVYSYDKSISIENVQYDVYLPESFKDNIFYSFEKEELESESENWVINSNYKVTYYVDQEINFTDEFYSYLNTLKERLDNENIIHNIYKSNEMVELEFVIENPNKDLIGYGILISYIPIKLINNNFDIFVLIPIDFDVLRIKGDMIESIGKNEFIPYKQFLENERLIDKN